LDVQKQEKAAEKPEILMRLEHISEDKINSYFDDISKNIEAMQKTSVIKQISLLTLEIQEYMKQEIQ